MTTPLAPGNLVATPQGQSVSLSASAPSGGTPPYSVFLWMDTDEVPETFNPQSLPLFRWLKSDAGLLTDSAAGFSGLATQVLDAGNALQLGGTSFTVGGWFQWGAGGAISTAWQKGVVGQATLEYAIYLDATNHITGAIGSGAATTTAATASPVSLGVWYFVLAWWDSVAQTWNLSVNGAAPTSVAWAAGTYNGSGRFQFGSATAPMNGAISGPFVFTRVLTGAEQTELYNGGLGLPFTHWPTALQTDSHYQDYFPFVEGTGSRRVDPAGSQGWWLDDTNLNVALVAGAMGSFAPTGTAVGWGHSPCEPISQWTDQTGNGNHAIQSAANNRPIFVPNVLNGLPAVRFHRSGLYNTVGTAMELLGSRSGSGTLLMLCKLRGQPASGDFWSLMSSKGPAGTFSEVLVEGTGRTGFAPWTFLNDYVQGQGVGFDQPPDTLSAHSLGLSYAGQIGLSNYLAQLDGQPQVLVLSGNLLRATTDLGSLGGRQDQYGNITASSELDVFEVMEFAGEVDQDTLALAASYLATRGGLATTAPAAPTLTAIGGSQAVALSWGTVAGATGWSIEASIHGQNAFEVVATLPPGQLSYVHGPVQLGTSMDYRIRATSAAFGYGAYSAVQSAQPFQWPQAAGSLIAAYESGSAYQDAGRRTLAVNQGDPIQGLLDLTLNGNHGWTTAANQATLQLNDGNGLPSIAFNQALPSWFNIDGGAALSDHTIFLVARWPAIDASIKPILGDATNYAAAVTSNQVDYLAGAQTTGAQTLPTSTAPVLLESIRAGSSWTVNWNCYALKSAVTVPTTAIGASFFGKAGTNFLNARVQALIVAPSNLQVTNPTLFAQIREYLRQKYSTPGVYSTVVIADSTTDLGSHDTGALSLNPDGSILCTWEAAATFGGIVHNIDYATSYDGGNTWSPATARWTTGQDLWRGSFSYGQKRLASGTTLWGIGRSYAGRNVFTTDTGHFLRSNDGGVSWTDPAPVTFDYSPFSPQPAYFQFFGQPVEPVQGGPLYWHGYGQPAGVSWTNSYFLVSNDRGQTWTIQGTIATGSATHAYSETAIINTGGSNWLALMRDDGTAGGNLAQCTSSDGGATWSAPTVPFTDKLVENVSPALLRLQSGSILAVYGHRNAGLRCRRSTNNGTSWNNPLDVFIPVASSDSAGYPGPIQRTDGLILVSYYCLFNSGAGGKTQLQLVGFPESALP
ncbi:MAG TPA: sialidase family protein [Gemmatimonadales bacterium]|nr:sialidase family protein [Gemmatimonadales bacterium]